MKVFENKSIFKKVAIVLIVLIICSFFFSGKVSAKGEIGGKLLSPICDFLVFLSDGVMNVIHTVVVNQNDTTITVDMTNSFWEILTTIFVGAVVAAVAALVVVVTAGAVVAAAAAIGVTVSTIGVGTVLCASLTTGLIAAAVFNSNVFPSDIQLPVYRISPDQIFSNNVLLLDVDFFNPKKDEEAKDANGNVIKDENGEIVYLQSTAKQLRTVISSWYVILRDIALVALLSVLVYIGIRILISSTSNDKAKYKQMLIDWIVAVCLLFVMQYIMSFSNLIVSKITDVLVSTRGDNGYTALIEDKDSKIANLLKEKQYFDDSKLNEMKVEIDGKKYISWPTDLLGIARINAQMGKKNSASYAGYTLIFLVLVLFTCYFMFTYLKRVLYMAFLTAIAPLVALTYPIDKINDGKAQAFNMWFKEYVFNLLIQPMHLILYTILVTSAFELASTNVIYSLVAIAFMIPAEKLLRKFFGFEKAQTPGLLAGPAGAAATMGIMNRILGKSASKGGGKSDSGKGKGDTSDNDESGIKFKDDLDDSTLIGESDEASEDKSKPNRNNFEQNNNTDNNTFNNRQDSSNAGLGNNNQYFEDKLFNMRR